MPVLTTEERNEKVKEIQQRVDELTFPELTKLTNQVKKQELNKIKQVLEAYLIRYKQAAISINQATQGLNLQDLDNHNKSLNLYICYKQLLSKIDVTSLLQDGYILVETLRKTFTEEEIEYEIGMVYGRGQDRKLINKKISLAELLSYAKADIQWGSSGVAGFKLRATSSQNDFLREYEIQKNNIEILLEDTHSLYPKVRKILLEHNYTNEGNFFETYQHLKYAGWADHSPKLKDPKRLTAQKIIDKYLEVRQGTQSFVSGGDYDLTQFKLLSGSGASIASLITIGDALKLILNYIERGEKANLTIENIKKNVFSKEFDNKMKNGLSDLIKDIDNELEQTVIAAGVELT